MFTSFSTALSALNAHTTAIDAVGNNLANLNTTGFKTSIAAFHDLVTQSMGGVGQTQPGVGVGRPSIIRQFSQGVVQTSSGSLDVAIQGDGFLVAQNQAGSTLYTRGGHLLIDKNGTLQTSTGEKVQGWVETNGTLTTTGPIGDIVVPVGTLKPPKASTSFYFDLNLDASAEVGDTFSNPMKVYDSLGNSHIVTVEFAKTAENEWGYSIADPGTDPPVTTTGTLTFDENGKLMTPAATDDPPTIDVTPGNGAAPMTLTWNLYDPDGLARLTQFTQPSAVSANAQDGAPAAQLIRVGILDGGQVYAEYSDGEQKTVGQLAMAAVRNPDSLTAVGNSNYQLSAETSLPAIGLPGTGGRGSIAGSAVEGSTVDIAKEFTNLIIYQRAFQANTRVITALDELSQDTINIKR